MKSAGRILGIAFTAMAVALLQGAVADGQPAGTPHDPALVRLAERAEAAIRAAGDGVGREFANRLRSEHRGPWLQYFKGEAPKPQGLSTETVAADIENILRHIASADSWPAPGLFKVPRAGTAPVIDGRLDDEVWKGALTGTGIYQYNKTENEGPRTTWRMLWDETHLYVAFDCEDLDIVAPDRERDGPVYNDDCVEVFLLPDFRFRTYWEILIAPNGSLYDSVQCKEMTLWGCQQDTTQNLRGLRHAQTIRGTINASEDVDEGYTVEIAIPFAELPGYTRAAPRPGDRLHFLLARLDRSKGVFGAYAFRPLLAWGHNIWNYAVMELQAE